MLRRTIVSAKVSLDTANTLRTGRTATHVAAARPGATHTLGDPKRNKLPTLLASPRFSPPTEDPTMAPLYALPGRAMLAVLVLLAVIVQHAHAGEMRIVEAGFNGKRGPKATDGMHFCPTTFSSRGFSIVCSPDLDDAGAPVDFQVDGRTVQRENHAPFTLAGDNRSGTILPWISFLSSPRIECLSRGERVASALIHISCTQARTPERAPDALPIATPMVLPIALPVLKPLRQPRYLTGHLQRPVAVKDACVVIRGSDFAPPASPGWDASSDGSVAFAKGDERLNIVAAGVSALQYTFFAPATASYGVTLDMETSGRTDHNGKLFLPQSG